MSIIRLKSPRNSRRGYETSPRAFSAQMKMAESSSASASASVAAGSNVLDLELAGVDSERIFDDQETTDEREISQTSETTSEAIQASSSKVVSFLDGLRASKKSELTRKRKIFTNPPRGGTHKRPSCSSNLKPVTPAQRVREFPNECFTLSARTLLHAARK